MADRALCLLQERLQRLHSEGKKKTDLVASAGIAVDTIKTLSALLPMVLGRAGDGQSSKNCNHENNATTTATMAQLVAACATRHFDSNPVQDATLEALQCLIRHGHVETVVSLKKCYLLLIHCMRNGTMFASAEASCLLHSLVKHDAVAVGRCLLSIPESPRLVTMCMAWHADAFPIQASLCSALEAMTLAAEEEGETTNDGSDATMYNSNLHDSQNGGSHYLEALLNVLERFPTSTTLVRSACRALIGLSEHTDEHLVWGHQQTICTAVAEALKGVKGHPIAQQAVLDLWVHLCLVENSAFCSLLARFLPLVLECLQSDNFLAHGPLQLHAACCKIIELTVQYEGPSIAKKHPECVSCLINSLLCHVASTRHCLRLLKPLAVMAGLMEFGPLLAAQKLESNVLCMTKVHLRDPRLVAATMTVLNNWAVAHRFHGNDTDEEDNENTTSSSQCLLSDRTLRFVVWSMTEYESDKWVQVHGCRILYNHLVSDTVRRHVSSSSKVLQHGAHLLPLLNAAATKFPCSCQRRAHFILARL